MVQSLWCFNFNVPLTIMSWRRDLGLESLLKDCRSGGPNQRPLECKVSSLTLTAPGPLLHCIWNPKFNVRECTYTCLLSLACLNRILVLSPRNRAMEPAAVTHSTTAHFGFFQEGSVHSQSLNAINVSALFLTSSYHCQLVSDFLTC